MNIKKAKEEVKNTLKAYFTKDQFGNYMIPIEKQRPIFLMGPPGIGKTAILEQIGSELNVPVLSYSMTHHTRQSALGLPYIDKKVYNGIEYSISEYTMSEIIASVYDIIAKTGEKEGILFLDEINCVSETLSPIMLQFLQYKIFGKHRIPDGFVVVTAGNPEEFNNSVREYDIATLDRMKKIEVEADYTAWREYASNNKTHETILSFLDIKKECFYTISTSIDGKEFVTARAWEDLSQMINLYELNNINVTHELIVQYIQHAKIAKEFSNYFTLYYKYKLKYDIENIANGKIKEDVIDMVKAAPFDEKLSLTSMLTSYVISKVNEVIEPLEICELALRELKIFKVKNQLDTFSDFIVSKVQANSKKIEFGNYSQKQRFIDNSVIKILEEFNQASNIDDFFKNNKKLIDDKIETLEKSVNELLKQIENIFKFFEAALNQGHEIMLFVKELTINNNTSEFIASYGCDGYIKHSKNLMISKVENEIKDKINKISM